MEYNKGTQDEWVVGLTRHDTVTPDTIWSESNSTTLHQTLDTGLGWGIVALLPTAHLGANRADGDNTAPLSVHWFLLDHLLSDGLSEEERAVHVHALGLQVQVGREIEQWPKSAYARVGHQRVDPTECLYGSLDNLSRVSDSKAGSLRHPRTAFEERSGGWP